MFYVCSAWLIICAGYDFRWRRLPNWLTLGVCISALSVLLVNQHAMLGSSVSSALFAFGLALLLTLPAYAMGWLGAGDVKMLAAMGLLGGISFLLISYVIAALLSVLLILSVRFYERTLPYFNLKLAVFGLRIPLPVTSRGKCLPFGTMLGIGGLFAIVSIIKSGGGL